MTDLLTKVLGDVPRPAAAFAKRGVAEKLAD